MDSPETLHDDCSMGPFDSWDHYLRRAEGRPSGADVGTHGKANLPVLLTRFFGREDEIAELGRVMLQDRLITVQGPPGCGKTRLVIELAGRAERRRDTSRTGLCFVDLTGVSGSGVVDAVAASLSPPDRGSVTPGSIASAVAGRQVVLVLDNCEGVRNEVASVASGLLAACPALRILAVSQLRLGVEGERVWQVPPLGLRATVELFRDRAQLASNTSSASATSDAEIARICEQLDRLPLAIELTAAWSRVLSVTQISECLDGEELVPGHRYSGQDRGQLTMDKAVDGTYRLLAASQQRMFERLSVCVCGFDLKAVDAVASSTDLLGDLTALVDRSLILVQPASDGATVRYRMLEPIRQCAYAALAARGELEVIARRHAEHYLRVATDADERLRGSDWSEALSELMLEERNLNAAFVWAERGDPLTALRLGVALATFWLASGHAREGWARMRRVIDTDVVEDGFQAKALSRAGRLAWMNGEHTWARALFQSSLTIHRGLGDTAAVARQLRDLAPAAIAGGDPDAAVRFCEESISVFRTAEDERGAATALLFLGWARFFRDDIEGSEEAFRASWEIIGLTEQESAIALILLGLSLAEWRRRDPPAQRDWVMEHLRVARALDGVSQEPDWLWSGFAFAVAEDQLAALCMSGGAEDLGRQTGIRPTDQLFESLQEPLLGAGGTLDPSSADVKVAHLVAQIITTRHPLSPREAEVAALVAQGLKNRVIVDRLFISKRTVETHVEHIKKKLKVKSRHELIAHVLATNLAGSTQGHRSGGSGAVEEQN